MAPIDVTPSAAAEDLERAFLRALSDTTKFNEEYQEVFERVVKTPTEQKERLADMQSVIDKFVAHTEVSAGCVPECLIPNVVR